MFNSKKYLLLILLFFVPGTIQGKALTPLETIKTSNDSILSLYRSFPDPDQHVLNEIFSIMDRVTDFDALADGAIQRICPNRNDEPCTTIRHEFIQLLKLTAMTKLGRYRADRFDYIGEETKGTRSLVKTRAHYKDDSVQLNYVLERRDGSWHITNYLIDDIDTIRNYQKQFQRIVNKEKLSGLLKRLRKKNEQYRQAEH